MERFGADLLILQKLVIKKRSIVEWCEEVEHLENVLFKIWRTVAKNDSGTRKCGRS